MSGIPSSPSTVTVSIISPNRVLGVPPTVFLEPLLPGTTYSDTPCLCFLIEHTQDGKTRNVLFDLGVRKDLNSGPPSAADAVRDMGITIDTSKDMEQILAEKSLKSADIDAIIFSHSHFDHVGDLAIFPNTTHLIVGSGGREKLVPGYPLQPESTVSHKDVKDRTIREMDFANSGLHVKGLRSIDFFGDGSFYLLDTPGHSVGHMSGLARTTSGNSDDGEASFMLLAGDVCHHAGALRPTELLRLSHSTVRSTLGHDRFSAEMVGASSSDQCRTQPFYKPSSGGFNDDSPRMVETLRLIQVFDADPQVFVVLAHDHWLLDVVDLFPKPANDWHSKGWAAAARWRFLNDFDFQKATVGEEICG